MPARRVVSTGESGETSESMRSDKATRRKQNTRRQVIQDDDEESDGDDRQQDLQGQHSSQDRESSDESSGDASIESDSEGSAEFQKDSDDEADETIVEQSLVAHPEVPQRRRARVISSVNNEIKVKNEQASNGDVFTETSIPDAKRRRTTPSSSSPSGPQTPSHPASSPSSQTAPHSSASRTPQRQMMPPQTPAAGVEVPFTPAAVPRTPAPPAQPKKRLVIHKMVLRNFKSYAGEQIIGPFHKSFSAVVGPNGSGKSNVIDAMLFVFGWRANKMRQGKLSELIHNSSGHESIGSCTVEIWFRDILDLPGPDDYKVIPNSRLVLARTAYRNNTSIYTLNNKKSSFTEVTTLLKSRGIDLDHKRFLILQGEVESIAQMPPKAKNEHEEGLLEYLEDIIGTSSYKTPIEEASKKVDELNENRGERLSRLKIVQKEKDSLESKKREAESFLRDQNELTKRQSALWQIYALECKDEIKNTSTAVDRLHHRIEEEMEKNAGSKTEMEALEKEFKVVNGEFQKVAAETDRIVKELAKFEKEEVQFQEKKKHLESKKKKLAKTMADEKHTSTEAKATLENSAEEIDSLGEEIAKLESSLVKEEADLEKIREGLKGKTQEFNDAIEKKQHDLQPWTNKRNEKQNAKNVAVEEKRLLEQKFGQAERETEEAKAILKDLQTANESKHDEKQRLKEEKIAQAKKISKYESELQTMGAEEAILRSKAATSRSKCEEAKAAMQSNQSRGDILSSLARQSDLGMIKGFHGRLGNLGTIEEKFDVAISTACPGLDNIVVEGVETGQACIEHLRRNNLGRANFILLNSLAKMNLNPIKTPEGVPRLYDLVKPRDERFAPAFYHQLRDTLVARDLAQANRIAYGAQRYRVVTLDGQLIDKSGTMSGGGTRVSRGAMSSKPVAQDISLDQLARIEKEQQIDQDGLSNHLKYMNDMRGMLAVARRRVPEIDMEVEKIDMDLQNDTKMIEEAQRRIGNLQSRHGPDAGDVSRVAELDAYLEDLEGELQSLVNKTSAIESDIAALQEKILEAGGVSLRAQKSKVDGIRERIDVFGERVTKAEVAKSKAEKDLAKLTKSSQKNDEILLSLEEEIRELDSCISEKAKDVSEVRGKVEESQYIMETKQEAKDDIKSKLDACSEGINAFRALEMEIKQKLEDNEKSLAENEKRLKNWIDKLEKLALHHIDESQERSQVEVESEDVNKGEKKEDQSADEAEDAELQEYSPDELRGMKKESIKSEIIVYEEKLQKGQANLSVLEEYKRRENEFLARARDLEQTTQERDGAKELHDNLRKERLESFMAGFSIISAKLKEMYQTITLGGNAELELVDSLDPFSEGILFSVMPPKKSWKNISNLSGGEKTLSSLALVFALHAFKPTPLYAMDELDAALDFRNVSIVANLIKERTKGAQFIVISLRNNMFELASRLVGIYKTNGQTKSLAVHNADLHALPAPPKTDLNSRASQQPLPTPSMTIPRSITATPFAQPALLAGQAPPSTVRRTAQTASSLMTPAPSRFSMIPQTPRTGNIKGLGMSSAASSVKLTSSHSIRQGMSSSISQGHALHDRSYGVPPATPLASRRPNL